MQGKIHSEKIGCIGDFSIHNLQDYYESIQENPELKDSLSPPYFCYINEEGALAARNIGVIMAKYDKTFNIRLSSKTEYSKIAEGNLIYVGNPLKEKFIGLFNEVNTYCEYHHYKLKIEGHPTINDTLLNIRSAYTEPYDYALVSKVRGAQNTEDFFLFRIMKLETWLC